MAGTYNPASAKTPDHSSTRSADPAGTGTMGPRPGITSTPASTRARLTRAERSSTRRLGASSCCTRFTASSDAATTPGGNPVE